MNDAARTIERLATDAERHAALVKIRTDLADARRKQQEGPA